MGMMRTCCGLYCAMCSLVGIYFFIILAIMEWRGNQYLFQKVQENDKMPQPADRNLTRIEIDNWQIGEGHDNQMIKGNAWIICAAINLVFTFACYICGMQSLNAGKEAAEKEKLKLLALYQRVENQDPN